MRDDLTSPNLGQTDREFKAEFFWQSYRIVEQWMTRILSKGPIQVSTLTADEVIAPKITATTVTTSGLVSANGGQIKFPATAIPSPDIHTLDDYEENPWTPTISFAGAAVGVTYTTQNGQYTKIGNAVVVNAYIVLSNKGSSAGQLWIDLPFPSAAAGYSPLVCAYYSGMALPVAAFPAVYVQPPGLDHAVVTCASTVAAYTAVTNAHCTNTTALIIGGAYRAAT